MTARAMNLIDCASGGFNTYSMHITTHAVSDANPDQTLCGRTITPRGRWSNRRVSTRGLSPHDCRTCLKRYEKGVR